MANLQTRPEQRAMGGAVRSGAVAPPTDRRYGYHSFPRRDKSTQTTKRRHGLEILRSMVTSGLLLTARPGTPPSATLPSATSGLRIGKTFAAFTVRTPVSLEEHARAFGKFAIEFEVDALVEMGALPALYLPLRDDQESHGRLLITRLQELGLVLERLDNTSLRNAEFQPFFRHLLRDTPPLDELLGAFRVVGSLIEPLGPSARDAVKFFEQREWRLLKNVVVPPAFEASPPTSEERQLLFRLDERLWTEPVGYRDNVEGPIVEKVAPRVDRSIFLRRIRGRHFLDYARRVVVPKGALEEAHSIIGESFPHLEVVPEALASIS